MQYTPPHSPPTHGQHDQHDHHLPISGFGHSIAPGIQSKSKVDHLTSEAIFAKRPISPPISSGETSESDSQNHSHIKQPHVSLLSALLHSPESQHLNPFTHSHSHSHSRPSSSSQGQGDYLSPHSSVPSTAMSSPNVKPSQPTQLVPAMSILRRDSVSSDGGEAFAMAQSNSQNQTLDVRTDVPKRASSLKFAVAPPSKRRPSETPGHEHVPTVPEIMADMPAPKRSDTDETPITPVSQDNEEEEEEEEEDEDTFAKERKDGLNEEDSDSDAGYQEDSEQSTDEEDRIRSAPKYPFARSTNYRRRRQAQSPSPPPAPAVLPPPTRRGRGHIRVDSSCISGKETEGGCSRHRSPPPSKSRSRSNSRERIGRLSDAGPRRNRAGSPMPTKILEASSDEDEAASPIKKPNPGLGNGWRSDDAAFYGPKSQVKGIRAVSAPSAVIVSDEEESADPHDIQGQGDGVRSFFRRASEHLPAFRRPKPMEPPLPLDHHILPVTTAMSVGAGSGAHSHGGRSPIPIHACPPALDNTPALANSIARVESNYSGGLAHRLEKTLSTRVSDLGVQA